MDVDENKIKNQFLDLMVDGASQFSDLYRALVVHLKYPRDISVAYLLERFRQIEAEGLMCSNIDFGEQEDKRWIEASSSDHCLGQRVCSVVGYSFIRRHVLRQDWGLVRSNRSRP